MVGSWWAARGEKNTMTGSKISSRRLSRQTTQAAQLCALAVGSGAVRKYLTLMRYRGDVRIFGKADGLAYRVIVLMDHPEAQDLVLKIDQLSRRRVRPG